MPDSLTRNESILLRDFIHEQWGIFLREDKNYLIENRLSPLVSATGCRSYGEYFLKVKHSLADSILRTQLVDAISTHETSWFRDSHPFEILKDRVLPEISERSKNEYRSGIRIWSAACSTGQEPYSIAMTIRDFDRSTPMKNRIGHRTKIAATDISATSLASAADGTYNSFAMSRGLNKDHINLYFTKNHDNWTVVDTIRQMVTFSPINLKHPLDRGMGPFDIIFLRNVIIYFSDELKKNLLNRLPEILSPSGYLFLGTGETLGGCIQDFDILTHKGTIFYRLKDKGKDAVKE